MVTFSRVMNDVSQMAVELCKGISRESFRSLGNTEQLNLLSRVGLVAATAGLLTSLLVGRKTAIAATITSGLGTFAYLTHNSDNGNFVDTVLAGISRFLNR